MARYFFAPRYLIRTTIDADEVSEIKAFQMMLCLGSRQRVNKIFREWTEQEILTLQGDHYVIYDLNWLKVEINVQALQAVYIITGLVSQSADYVVFYTSNI